MEGGASGRAGGSAQRHVIPELEPELGYATRPLQATEAQIVSAPTHKLEPAMWRLVPQKVLIP